jgi:hypothetical protein
MDSVEFTEWVTFDRIEPLPRHSWETGMVCATIASAAGVKRAKPEQFMLKPKRPRRMDSRELKARMSMIADAVNAKRLAEQNKSNGSP